MKKTTLSLLTLCLLAIAPSQAQTFMNGILVSHAKTAGTIYLNDGSELTFPIIEIPANSDKTIKAKDENKNVQKFDAAEIHHLELWNEDMPDKHHILAYVPYDMPTMRNRMVWAAFVTQSEYLTLFILATTYAVDKQGRIAYFYQQGFVPIPILYDRHKEAYLVAYQTTSFGYNKKDIKRIQDFLQADPVMVDFLGTKEFKGREEDFVYIVDNYTPTY